MSKQKTAGPSLLGYRISVRPASQRRRTVAALIYPVSLIVVAAVAHYWFHLSDSALAFMLVLIAGWHELDKITDRLDAINESVDSLMESPHGDDKGGPNNCPTCGGLICTACGKPCSEDYADCPTCGRHWKGDGICGQRWTEAALKARL